MAAPRTGLSRAETNDVRRLPPRTQRPHTVVSRLIALTRARFDRRRFLALLLVLAVGFWTASTIERSRALQAELGETQSVVLASSPLPAGHRITADDVMVRARPTGFLPPGSRPNASDVVGLTVRADIEAGEAIVDHRLSHNRLGLDPNERAVTVALPFAPPPLQPGDIVDLVGLGAATAEYEEPVGVASTPLGQARVMAVTEDGITVAVSLEQVRPLLEHLAIGTVELVITPFG